MAVSPLIPPPWADLPIDLPSLRPVMPHIHLWHTLSRALSVFSQCDVDGPEILLDKSQNIMGTFVQIRKFFVHCFGLSKRKAVYKYFK